MADSRRGGSGGAGETRVVNPLHGGEELSDVALTSTRQLRSDAGGQKQGKGKQDAGRKSGRGKGKAVGRTPSSAMLNARPPQSRRGRSAEAPAASAGLCRDIAGLQDGPRAMCCRAARSGRWLMPADLIRNHVKTPWVYYLVATTSVLLTTSLALGGSLFKFPGDMSTPVVKHVSLHCIFEPVNQTGNPVRRIVDSFSKVVSFTPEGPDDLGKCHQEWLTNGNTQDTITPPPVVRVANFAQQGVKGVAVTATVSELLDPASGSPANTYTKVVDTGVAGFAKFDTLVLNPTTTGGAVFLISFTVAGSDEVMSFKAAKLDVSGSNDLTTTITQQVPSNIVTGTEVTVAAHITQSNGADAVNIPVEAVLMAVEPILVTGLPDVQTTDASGTVSFTFKVVSGHTQPTLVRLRTSGGHTSSNIMTVTTEVESVEVLVPPLPVNRVGSSVGSGRKDWRTSNVIIVSTDNTPDNVVVCSKPRLQGKQVRVQTEAASEVHELLLDVIAGNFTFPQLGTTMMPMLKGELSWEGTGTTGPDGCAYLANFMFSDGSNGNYFVKFDIDGKFQTTGPHYLVNPSVPLFGNMRFLSGGGPFVTMWLFFSILGAVYLVLMNPGHGIWPRLLGVAYGCGWMYLAFVLATTPEGTFYSGLGLSQIEFMPECCTFNPNTAPENVLELLLVFTSTGITLIAFFYMVQSLWSNEYLEVRGQDGTTFRSSLLWCRGRCPTGCNTRCQACCSGVTRVVGSSQSHQEEMLQSYYGLVRRLISVDEAHRELASSKARMRQALEKYSADSRSFEYSAVERATMFGKSVVTFFVGLGRFMYALLGHWWVGPCFLAKRSVTAKAKERNGTCRGLARYFAFSAFEFGRALVMMFYDLALFLRAVGVIILGIRLGGPAPVNRHAPFETADDFYYPPKLIMTCALSNFFTFIVGLFFAVGIDWAVQWGYAAIAEWESTSAQIEMVLLWPPSKSRFNPLSRAIMSVVGLGLFELREVLEPATYDLIFAQIVPPAVAGLSFAVWVGVLVGWMYLLRNYKRKVFLARQGKFDFKRDSVRLPYVTKFMGYQAMHTLIAFFSIFGLVFVTVLFLVLSIFIIPLQQMEIENFKVAMTPPHGFLFSFLLVYITYMVVAFTIVDFKNRVRSMPMFVVFDHFYSVLCLLLGMVTALKRLLIIIFALVFSFWRLDLSWISMMDSGHSSFNAVLMCQHHFNNPVVMVFCDQVFKEINARRKAKKLHARPRSDWLACPIPCSICCCCMPCCCRGQLQPGEGAFVAGPNTWLKTAPESSRGLVDDVEANQGVTPAPSRRVRRLQLSFRFWLALTLHRNPTLRKYRRARLPSVQVAARVITSTTNFSAEMHMRVSAIGSRTVWSKQLVVLRDVYMVMYAGITSQRPHLTIPLRDVIVVATGGKSQDELSIATTYTAFDFRFKDAAMRQQWQTAIQRVVDDIRVKGEDKAGDGERRAARVRAMGRGKSKPRVHAARGDEPGSPSHTSRQVVSPRRKQSEHTSGELEMKPLMV